MPDASEGGHCMIGSPVLLLLLLLAVGVAARQHKSFWILVLAAVPIAWDLLDLHGAIGGVGYQDYRPVSALAASFVLLLFHAAHASSWLAPVARARRRKDSLLLILMYALNVVVFVWLQVVPGRAAAQVEPYFLIIVVGILPILQFRLLHYLFAR
jgi:hypothetical protein